MNVRSYSNFDMSLLATHQELGLLLVLWLLLHHHWLSLWLVSVVDLLSWLHLRDETEWIQVVGVV